MKICVCGSGTMGSGIAQVLAVSGYETILFDVNKTMLINAREKISNELDKRVGLGKITVNEKEKFLLNLFFTSEITECRADIIIEAIVEKIDIKVSLFNQLADINSKKTIFASNTSSLSISEIAQKTKHPERVAGIHFFNPASFMKLVEIVRGKATEEWVIDELIKLAQKLGKVAVLCKDSPGFIVNRVARPYYIQSLRLAEKGIDFATIDEIMEVRGFKMGPFKLMDLIGNDINYAVSCSVYEQLNKPERLRPSYIQKEKVDKGELGRKTGKGYYNYS